MKYMGKSFPKCVTPQDFKNQALSLLYTYYGALISCNKLEKTNEIYKDEPLTMGGQG